MIGRAIQCHWLIHIRNNTLPCPDQLHDQKGDDTAILCSDSFKYYLPGLSTCCPNQTPSHQNFSGKASPAWFIDRSRAFALNAQSKQYRCCRCRARIIKNKTRLLQSGNKRFSSLVPPHNKKITFIYMVRTFPQGKINWCKRLLCSGFFLMAFQQYVLLLNHHSWILVVMAVVYSVKRKNRGRFVTDIVPLMISAAGHGWTSVFERREGTPQGKRSFCSDPWNCIYDSIRLQNHSIANISSDIRLGKFFWV